MPSQWQRSCWGKTHVIRLQKCWWNMIHYITSKKDKSLLWWTSLSSKKQIHLFLWFWWSFVTKVQHLEGLKWIQSLSCCLLMCLPVFCYVYNGTLILCMYMRWWQFFVLVFLCSRWTWKLPASSNKTLRRMALWRMCVFSWTWPMIQRKLLACFLFWSWKNGSAP